MRCLVACALGSAVVAAPPARDTPVQLWFCDNPASQTWKLNVSGSATAVALQGTPFVWDLVGPSNKTGTGVHLFTPYATKSQQFIFKRATGQLESVFAPGKCVAAAAPGAPVIAGVSLTIQSCAGNGSTEQSFAYNAASGVMALAADVSLCVDAGSSTNCSVPPQSGYPFCDPELPPDARAADRECARRGGLDVGRGGAISTATPLLVPSREAPHRRRARSIPLERERGRPAPRRPEAQLRRGAAWLRPRLHLQPCAGDDGLPHVVPPRPAHGRGLQPEPLASRRGHHLDRGPRRLQRRESDVS